MGLMCDRTKVFSAQIMYSSFILVLSRELEVPLPYLNTLHLYRLEHLVPDQRTSGTKDTKNLDDGVGAWVEYI